SEAPSAAQAAGANSRAKATNSVAASGLARNRRLSVMPSARHARLYRILPLEARSRCRHRARKPRGPRVQLASFTNGAYVTGRPMKTSVTSPELLDKLGIPADGLTGKALVHAGGPVEEGRGFVLHSDDYVEDNTLVVGNMALTATLDILRAIGRGQGPRKSLLALGYAGWGPGQLDAEKQDNGWLHVAADEGIVFGGEIADKWQRALAKLGIDPLALSGDAGHA